jgi:addiction module RelB/DinJ family antitoxin
MSVQVSTRIDEATKQQFDKVCELIGVSPSNALSMFIKGVINYNGIPFNVAAQPVVKVPKMSKETAVRPAFEYGSMAGSTASPENVPKMSRESVFGCMRGQFQMADDFDAPLEDFREYME